MDHQMDAKRWPAMREQLADVFSQKPRAHWEQLFDGSDACVSPVLSLAEAPSHPHNIERGLFTDRAEKDATSCATWVTTAPALSRTPSTSPAESSRASEHANQTDEMVIHEWLSSGHLGSKL